MSAAAVCEEQVQVRRERRPCGHPTGLTLGAFLTRAHEDVHARGFADCPACGGTMELVGVQALCSSCGARLS